MPVIEIETFRLRDGVDEAAFLDADGRVQAEAVPNQPGFLRRTTARGPDGDWIVIVLWGSAEEADAARPAIAEHPATEAFGALVDPDTVRAARYETLD